MGCQKLRLLLWKNWTLRKRHTCSCFCEFFLPIWLFGSMFLGNTMNKGGGFFGGSKGNTPHTTSFQRQGYWNTPQIGASFPEYSQEALIKQIHGRFIQNSSNIIGFAPRSQILSELAKNFQDDLLIGNQSPNISCRNFEDENEMESFFKTTQDIPDKFKIGRDNFIFGFVFDGLSGDLIGKKVSYKIRTKWDNLATGVLINTSIEQDPGFNPSVNYRDSGILGAQLIIDKHLIKMMSQNDNWNVTISVQAFPRSNRGNDNNGQRQPNGNNFLEIDQAQAEHASTSALVLSGLVVLCFIFMIPSVVGELVSEKETGIKELMKMSGLSECMHWLGWFISSLGVITFNATFITICLCLTSASIPGIISKSDPTVIWTILMLYGIWACTYCFLISAFFQKPSLATTFGILLWLFSFTGIGIGLMFYLKNVSSGIKLFLCLFPNIALLLAFSCVMRWESTATTIYNYGATWTSLSFPIDKNLPTLSNVILMMMGASLVNILLCLYVEAVLPKKFGARKSPFFVFTCCMECLTPLRDQKVAPVQTLPASNFSEGKMSKNEEKTGVSGKLGQDETAEIEGLPSNQKQFQFEKELEGWIPGVQVFNLRKEFGGKKVAVEDLSVNMFQGQIFCLLGENGAGKTTTMSILTGLMSATSGTALIAGHDIRTNMNNIRNSLGLCPQHNMLFDRLTLIEHIQFFGALKGLSKKDIEQDGLRLLASLSLLRSTYDLSSTLSGGQKRRLQLGCALIGDPKVLILDEPSSGMDPDARRSFWNLLLYYRLGKTVILTTHYMEEADYLADRIGIMAQGKLLCCGSPAFLKRLCVSGVTLNVTVGEGADRDKILNVVRKHVEDAYFKESVFNSDSELAILLPSTQPNTTAKFPAMFKELLMNRKEELNIVEAGVTWTKMEDVFVKVNLPQNTNGKAERNQNPNQTLPAAQKSNPAVQIEKSRSKADTSKPERSSSQVTPTKHEESKGNEKTSPTPIASPPSTNTGAGLYFTQLFGLLIKNLLIMYRKRGFFMLQLLLPVLFTVGVTMAASSLLKLPSDTNDIQPNPAPPQRQLYLGDYENLNSTILYFSDTDSDEISAAYLKVLGNSSKTEKVPVPARSYWTNTFSSTFSKHLISLVQNNPQDFRERYIVGAEMLKSGTSLIAWHSNVAIHSAPLSVNLLTNALLQHRIGDASYTIQTSIHPFHDGRTLTNLTKVLDYVVAFDFHSAEIKYYFALILATFWPMVMALFVTNFMIEPTEERLNQGKLLQFMTGINPFQYWGSFFLSDLLLSILVIIGMLITMLALEEHNLFSSGGGLGVLFLIFVVFALAAIPMSYVFSTFAKSTSEGLKQLIFTHIFTGIVLAVVTFVLQAYIGYQWLAITLHAFGRLFHGFSLVNALVSYAYNSVTNLECNSIPEKYLRILCEPNLDWSVVGFEKYRVQGIIPKCCKNCRKLATENEECLDLSYFQWTERASAYDEKGILSLTLTVPGIATDLISLLFLGVIYFIFLMFIEYGIIWKPQVVQKKSTPRVNEEDVAKERKRVKNMVDNALTSEDALVVSMLSKTFGSFFVVNGLSFGVHFGECFGLLGVNGAGKTTTFRMLTGEEKISFGDAFMKRLCLSKESNKFIKGLGYCPQFDAVVEVLTGKEMLCLYGRLRGLKGNEVQKEADKWLEKTGLTESGNVQCGKYSGGMKRRLSTAIALIGDPPVILLDEPTSGVDPVARRQFWKIISSLKNSGQAIILTSHNMEECEATCNRLGIMVNGELQCFGGVQHLKSKFAQGYSLTVILNPDLVKPKGATFASEDERLEERREVIQNIFDTFEDCSMKSSQAGVLNFQIKDAPNKAPLTWEELYTKMEQTKRKCQGRIEEYYILDSSLEDVFISFAKRQQADKKPEQGEGEKRCCDCELRDQCEFCFCFCCCC